MPPRKQPKNSEAPSATEMDDLPPGVLPIIASFLPAHDAVRTCALARHWLNVWISAPALRITGVRGFRSDKKFNDFVDRLLSLRRDGAHLESCEFDLDQNDFDFDDWFVSAQHLYDWSLQSALDCHVRVLRFRFRVNLNPFVFLHNLPKFPDPFLSQHLTRLELQHIRCPLDFSGCPALADLKMEECVAFDEQMSSPSLQHLSMTRCEFYIEHRTPIILPSLVRLELIDCSGRLPLLESLPSLETAIVRLGRSSGDQCSRSASACLHDHPCDDCRFHFKFDASRGSSYFFQGFSQATHLELSAYYRDAYIFQRDLKWRPTFPMLKTLILDDWCLEADLSAVILFIQNSPNLEKLTLELDEEFNSSIVTQESNNPLESTVASDHLKLVEIKFQKVDARIEKILKMLRIRGIKLEKINIRQTNTGS